MKLILSLSFLSVLICSPVIAQEQEEQQEPQKLDFYAEKEKYERKSAELDSKISRALQTPTKSFNDAVKLYREKKFLTSRNSIRDSYKKAFLGLDAYYPLISKEKIVPKAFAKELIEKGMTAESFDTMVLSISATNAVNSCQVVKVAPPSGGIIGKLAVGFNKQLYNKVLAVGEIDGYVEPFSHDFFRAASAIYLMGLASFQDEYETRMQWIKEILETAELPSQKEALIMNAEVTQVGIDYVEKQVQLKNTFKQMLLTAANYAKDEMNTKASRVSYRGGRKEKAEKDYNKKKKRAHISDHAARDAVKAYQVYKTRKYEFDQARVHTHITCEKSPVETASVNLFEKSLDILFPKAMAEEAEEHPMYVLYLDFIEEQKKSTNTMMATPENRYKFLNTESVDLVKKDIGITQTKVQKLQKNLESINNLYNQFVGSDEGIQLEGGGGEIRNNIKPDIKTMGTSVVNNADAGASSDLSSGLSAGYINSSDLLKNVSAGLKRNNGDFKEVKFVGPEGDSKAVAGNYLEDPSSNSFAELKKKSLEKLTDSQRKGLLASYKGNYGKKENLETIVAAKTTPKKDLKKVVKAKRKLVDLPDIESDSALKLLKNKTKKVKIVNDEDVEPINEESLALLKSGKATDINKDRGTSIWIIISNRYIKSGFEKLKERK